MVGNEAAWHPLQSGSFITEAGGAGGGAGGGEEKGCRWKENEMPGGGRGRGDCGDRGGPGLAGWGWISEMCMWGSSHGGEGTIPGGPAPHTGPLDSPRNGRVLSPEAQRLILSSESGPYTQLLTLGLIPMAWAEPTIRAYVWMDLQACCLHTC